MDLETGLSLFIAIHQMAQVCLFQRFPHRESKDRLETLAHNSSQY